MEVLNGLKEFFVLFILVSNVTLLCYYVFHTLIFTRRVKTHGKCLEVTLVEKKIKTGFSTYEKHGRVKPIKLPILFFSCTYVVKITEGRTTKKDVRVESVEPIHCYFKQLHNDYKIWMLELNVQKETKFKRREVRVATNHDYYIMLNNIVMLFVLFVFETINI